MRTLDLFVALEEFLECSLKADLSETRRNTWLEHVVR